MENTAITKATVATAVPNTAPKPTVGLTSGMAKFAPPLPKGLRTFNTQDLKNKSFIHAIIYSDTSARKTSTAAKFGTPENTRIILTRTPEQLIPLAEDGYQAVSVTDGEALMYALQFPEKIWPDWAEREDKVLVLDDITEGVQILLEENQVIDGKEVRDRRRSYTATGEDLRLAIQSVLNKPMHFIVVATAKVKDNQLTNEEQIGPDLPPSMLTMIQTAFEFVLYIDTKTYMFFTDRQRFSYKSVNEQGKEQVFTRIIFAKHKLPLPLLGKGIIAATEKLDLRALWDKWKNAVGATK